MEFQTATLDNGLQIIAEVNPAAASLACGFFVRTGSRDETAPVSGVSHFLEHMVFKGTARRSAFDVNRDFDRMGAIYNAFTSEENTVYFASVLPEFQHDSLDLLCDILRPSLKQEDFDVEKEVILDEIALYEDRPQFRLYDHLMSEHFAGHPLGQSILGTPESIQNLQRDDMQAYFDRRYSPTNVVLVAVGNLDFDALVAQAQTACGHWQPFDAPRAITPCTGARTRNVIADASLARQNLGLFSPAPSASDNAHHAAQLLTTVLGDVSGSRLYYALIETALADEAHMSYAPMDGTGAMMTFLSCGAEQAKSVLTVTLEEYRRFLDAGATEAELQAAKNKIASGATLKGELPMGRLTAVGMDWVYRNEYKPLAEQIDDLFAVDADAILAVAQDSEITNPTALALGPIDAFPDV